MLLAKAAPVPYYQQGAEWVAWRADLLFIAVSAVHDVLCLAFAAGTALRARNAHREVWSSVYHIWYVPVLPGW